MDQSSKNNFKKITEKHTWIIFWRDQLIQQGHDEHADTVEEGNVRLKLT
jgi:hypothetical protein